MCDVLLGVQGCVTKCDRGGGLKLAKNSLTYFMDGPLGDGCSFFNVSTMSSFPLVALWPIGYSVMAVTRKLWDCGFELCVLRKMYDLKDQLYCNIVIEVAL